MANTEVSDMSCQTNGLFKLDNGKRAFIGMDAYLSVIPGLPLIMDKILGCCSGI